MRKIALFLGLFLQLFCYGQDGESEAIRYEHPFKQSDAIWNKFSSAKERVLALQIPKDILKAVYAESLYNDVFNEALYNEKLKEYLINIMGIKGECGNFNSAIKSLKWFGYGDKISISKLLKTDNDFKAQYIFDYFNISNDVITSFKIQDIFD